MQRRALGCRAHAQVGVPGLRPREEQQVRDAEGTAHGDIIAQPVGLPLLQPGRRSRLHHAPHVRGQLANACPNLAGADADDHAFGVVRVQLARPGRSPGFAVGVGCCMGPLLGAPLRHDCWRCVWVAERDWLCQKFEVLLVAFGGAIGSFV